MKLVTIAFLFFYGFNPSICASNKYQSAQESDSLLYYYNLVNSPKKSTDLPKALNFYQNLKGKYLEKQDTIQAVQTLRQIARIQNNWGDYYASESSVVEALKLLINANVKDTVVIEAKIGLYNQVGRISEALLKYDFAIEYYNKALELTTLQSHKNTLKNNIALIYRDQEKYKLAETIFQEVYQSNLSFKSHKKAARVLNNLGLVRLKLKNPIALNNLEGALEVRLEVNDVEGSYSSYKNLSIYYDDNNNNAQALFYASKALEVANTLNAASYKVDALSQLLELDNNPQLELYKHLTDSLKKSNHIRENKSALLKFNVEEERNKTQKSNLKKEIEHKEKLVAQGVTVMIVLLSAFLYFILRSRHKKEKLQEVYNTEARISKKIHDEVANDVYQVMTKVQHNTNASDDVLDDLEHIYTKTRDISKDNSAIDVVTNFEGTLNELLINYRNDNVGVVTKGLKTINWNAFSDIKKTTIYRILQELMTNMKKHSNASVVAITFTRNKSKVLINYKDNGDGCTLKKQIGLQNTETRIASVNGTITFDSQPSKGFNAKIVV